MRVNIGSRMLAGKNAGVFAANSVLATTELDHQCIQHLFSPLSLGSFTPIASLVVGLAARRDKGEVSPCDCWANVVNGVALKRRIPRTQFPMRTPMCWHI